LHGIAFLRWPILRARRNELRVRTCSHNEKCHSRQSNQFD
jgi:hypothetical protein